MLWRRNLNFKIKTIVVPCKVSDRDKLETLLEMNTTDASKLTFRITFKLT